MDTDITTLIGATTATVVLRGVGGTTTTVTATMAELDPSEQGLSIGTRFIPWHRIVSYGWPLRQSTEVGDGHHRVTVRFVVDEGTATRIYEVPADRFELGPWTMTALLEDRVEPEEGLRVFRRVSFPWEAVQEYERIVAAD